MSILKNLLSYKKICIECHNNPDADTVASAFGVYSYLKSHGVDSFIVYGGRTQIKKSSMKILIDSLNIPIQYTNTPGDFDLLVMIDCQYKASNTEFFESENVVIIDHHVKEVEDNPNYLIKSDYQSCSTIIWELLKEENFDISSVPNLDVALLFGLYTDTSCFADLYGIKDSNMRIALFDNQPLFEKLIKSNMTVAELMVASDAIHNHYFDTEKRFAVVEALSCDQAVLGIIGDFMIQVDIIDLNITYCKSSNGYSLSLRACRNDFPANQIIKYICEGIGSGGGHHNKAGGFIVHEKLVSKYGDISLTDIIIKRVEQFVDNI